MDFTQTNIDGIIHGFRINYSLLYKNANLLNLIKSRSILKRREQNAHINENSIPNDHFFFENEFLALGN